mmetsp:Transcript_99506/g.310720  ORF Transcript_99506/g.310720 Transcript_99506/m.310720 type:complete len:581 (-) Transcript_99506:340-2082(-)
MPNGRPPSAQVGAATALGLAKMAELVDELCRGDEVRGAVHHLPPVRLRPLLQRLHLGVVPAADHEGDRPAERGPYPRRLGARRHGRGLGVQVEVAVRDLRGLLLHEAVQDLAGDQLLLRGHDVPDVAHAGREEALAALAQAVREAPEGAAHEGGGARGARGAAGARPGHEVRHHHVADAREVLQVADAGGVSVGCLQRLCQPLQLSGRDGRLCQVEHHQGARLVQHRAPLLVAQQLLELRDGRAHGLRRELVLHLVVVVQLARLHFVHEGRGNVRVHVNAPLLLRHLWQSTEGCGEVLGQALGGVTGVLLGSRHVRALLVVLVDRLGHSLGDGGEGLARVRGPEAVGLVHVIGLGLGRRDRVTCVLHRHRQPVQLHPQDILCHRLVGPSVVEHRHQVQVAVQDAEQGPLAGGRLAGGAGGRSAREELGGRGSALGQELSDPLLQPPGDHLRSLVGRAPDDRQHPHRDEDGEEPVDYALDVLLDDLVGDGRAVDRLVGRGEVQGEETGRQGHEGHVAVEDSRDLLPRAGLQRALRQVLQQGVGDRAGKVDVAARVQALLEVLDYPGDVVRRRLHEVHGRRV